MKQPLRTVPHSVRSLAEQAGANRSTIGFMLTGERPSVDEGVAKGVSEALGVPLAELFTPDDSPSREREPDEAGDVHD
jgi:transcriptional regulator with XRE-family HTH domain